MAFDITIHYLWGVSVRIHLLLSLAWKQKLLLFRWFPLPGLTSNGMLVGLSDNPLDIKLKRSPWHLLASPHKGVKVDISRRVNIVLCRLSVLKQSIVKSNTSFTICLVKKYGSIPKRLAFAWLLKRKKLLQKVIKKASRSCSANSLKRVHLVLDQLVPPTLQEIPGGTFGSDRVEKTLMQKPVEDAAVMEGCSIVERCPPLLVFGLTSLLKPLLRLFIKPWS